MKIKRVRAYLPPNPNQLFNQSDVVVTIETDAGITGIGEGGSKDMLSQSAGRLIGCDPQHIELLWQDMNRAFFYPAGREKTHAIGALDLALWDIRGKALGAPVYELLGGARRKTFRCYATHPLGRNLEETSRFASILRDQGFSAVKFGWRPLGQDPIQDEAIVR